MLSTKVSPLDSRTECDCRSLRLRPNPTCSAAVVTLHIIATSGATSRGLFVQVYSML